MGGKSGVDDTKYISNQILYEASKTLRIEAVLAVVKLLERCLLHVNFLVVECLGIETNRENMPRSNRFPQILLSYRSDNRPLNREGRVVLCATLTPNTFLYTNKATHIFLS